MKKKVNIKYKFEDLVVFEDKGPQYDGAGFSVEDREEDLELTHHCDDLSCNCSIQIVLGELIISSYIKLY